MDRNDTGGAMDDLPWPLEASLSNSDELRWHASASNRVLDFHGDPASAQLTVFSDGNHHMALAQSLQAFAVQFPAVGEVFYVTLPPAVLLPLMARPAVRLGNLRLTLRPHIFISPLDVLDALAARKQAQPPTAFARSRGCALLVARGNPRQVGGLDALLRDDIRLFISNPERERASFVVYSETLCTLAQRAGLDARALAARLETGTPGCMHGQRVHHREAPTAVALGHADVAVLYHHLALRYVRAFPDRFDMVALPGSTDVGAFTDHVVTTYGIALLGDGGPWGASLQAFMQQDTVAEIYRHHGLEAVLAAG